MNIVTLGIDLAENVFALHGVDAAGNAVLVLPSVSRDKMLEHVARLSPCLIGMEACSGASSTGYCRRFWCGLASACLGPQVSECGARMDVAVRVPLAATQRGSANGF